MASSTNTTILFIQYTKYNHFVSEIDTTRMVKLLDEFGNYLRLSFSIHNTQTFLALQDELELTRSYLSKNNIYR